MEANLFKIYTWLQDLDNRLEGFDMTAYNQQISDILSRLARLEATIQDMQNHRCPKCASRIIYRPGYVAWCPACGWWSTRKGDDACSDT